MQPFKLESQSGKSRGKNSFWLPPPNRYLIHYTSVRNKRITENVKEYASVFYKISWKITPGPSQHKFGWPVSAQPSYGIQHKHSCLMATVTSTYTATIISTNTADYLPRWPELMQRSHGYGVQHKCGCLPAMITRTNAAVCLPLWPAKIRLSLSYGCQSNTATETSINPVDCRVK